MDVGKAFPACCSPRRVGTTETCMLNTLIKYRTETALALGMIAATATVIIFQIVLQLSWLISVPAAILAYVTAFVVWIRYFDSGPGE